MIAERTKDLQLIRSAAFNKKIIIDLLEDGETIKDCDFNVEEDCFLSVTLKDKLIAIYILKPKSNTVLDIHPMVIPEHRNHGNKSMMCVFEWIINNCARTMQKVVAEFPSKSKNIERFAIHNGFKKEGVNRLSFMKNGELLDQTIVGITRKEIEEVLKCQG